MSKLLTAVVAALLLLPAAARAERFDASVSRTSEGVAHIRAQDFSGIGYGYARALAEDTICTLAEVYVTVNGQRSRYFGPEGRIAFRGNGSTASNLNSDLFFQEIIDSGRIERLLRVPPPVGPRKEIFDGVRGFVAGYNSWLRDQGGRDGIDDPTCRGEEWVRPITEMDVWRRFHQLALLASSGVAIDGIAGAQPPGPGAAPAQDAVAAARSLEPGVVDERLGGLGSNAVGLGRDATSSGHGLLYGNPHFPWQGPERFFQAHLTVPGKADVAGGSLLGVPLILIGHTRTMAWSHTVSTARRFVPYEVRLVPGDPTAYVVDGQVRRMSSRRVTVQVKRGDRLEPVSRTLYRTHHGPILTSILGLPVFPWTPERAFAMYDANEENFGRLFNHFFEMNQAGSVDEVDRILRRYLGIPWVNTVAADTDGNAYYADIGSIPHVTEDKRSACETVVGTALDLLQRLIVLDGSRAACEPGTDPDAIVPGILGPGRLPSLRRRDHVSNMNDSYWLTHPEARLEGFPRIIGDERTPRTLRTRMGLRLIQDRLAGRDGLPGTKFDVDNLRAVAMSNRVFAGELWRDDLVAFCKASPTVLTQAGPVDVSAACPVLERWDLRDDLDSRGALLFRRFVTRVTGALPVPLPYLSAPVPGMPFARPFDVRDPIGTPSGLNTLNPVVSDALGRAVQDLRGAGIALDAPLRDGASVTRRGERIPIHGGPHASGVFNVITPTWDPRKGYTEVVHGSSYVQAVELLPTCPKAHTILTYGQSTNPRSERTADQTKLYAQKRWLTPPFCSKDLEADRSLQRTHVAERPGARLLDAVRVTEGRGRARPRVAVLLRGTARVVVTVQRGRAVVRRIVRRLRAGERVLAPQVRKGRYTLRVTARAGRRVESARFTPRQR
ncbi:MAG TPA: penicillin acylase family protein [Baekduia sp.]|nr:penicillin acylase family protein [Baekduia sp.]